MRSPTADMLQRCTACVGEHLAFEPGIEELVRVDEGEESDGKTNPYTGTVSRRIPDGCWKSD